MARQREPANLEDRELVRRAKAGDQEAFSALVERHASQALTLAWRMLGSQHQAWDAAQEAYLSAWRNLGQFREESEFFTWLRRILVNVCLQELRQRKHDNLVYLDDYRNPGGPQETDGGDAGRDSPAQAVEQRLALKKALGNLPVEHRVTFWLHEVEGLGYEEIAEVLGVPEGTVKSRMYTARGLLRKALEEG